MWSAGAACTMYVVYDAAGQLRLPYVETDPEHRHCCGWPTTRALGSTIVDNFCCFLPCVKKTCSDSVLGMLWGSAKDCGNSILGLLSGDKAHSASNPTPPVSPGQQTPN